MTDVKKPRAGQFVKGDPRVYRGGRKKKGIVQPKDILTDILNENKAKQGTKTWWEAICRKAVSQAASGNRYARDWVTDRVFGKVKDVVELEQRTDPLKELVDHMIKNGLKDAD